MNHDETATILKARSSLTSQPYGPDVVDIWHEALKGWTYTEVRNALIRAGRDHPRISIAHVVERLAPLPSNTPEGHPRSCICAGRGFIEIEQRDARHSWWAWARCPDGPPTGFIEID